MKKRLFTMLLALAIVFTMSFAGAPAFAAAAEGIAISTPEDLKAMENNPSGSITVTGVAFVGGIAGYADPWDSKVVSNYNTGKIKASTKGTFKGQVIGGYEGAEVVRKRNIYDNYYTGSGKAYGAASVTWKDWVAKATKVSSISKSKCPKLSSKYWTYSSKYKRMILKNNKEK